MASIGELTATVRADIQGYVGPMRQVVATNQQVATITTTTARNIQFLGQSLTQSAGSSNNAAVALEHVQRVAVLVGAETAGVGTHFGRLAAQLSMLSGAGGILALVAVGFIGVAEAIKASNDAAEKSKQTIDDLAKAYDDMTGATVKNNLAQAQAAVAQAERNTHFGITSTVHDFGRFGVAIPGLGQVRDLDALAKANKALVAAQKELDDWTQSHTVPWQHTLADTLRDQARAAEMTAERMHVLMASGTNPLLPFTNADRGAALDVLAQSRDIAAARAEAVKHIEDSVHLDASDVAIMVQNNQLLLERLGMLENQAEKEKRIAQIKGDASVKDAVKMGEGDMRGVAEGAARGFASAFGNALRGQTKNLLESIASVLKDAILGAIDKLISEKVFEALMHAFSASKGGGSGTGGWVKDIVGSVFSAPSVPMAGAMAGGGTVMVSGASIPPALSPVEHARDQQWQALLIESNRVAEANGARWRYVSR